MEFNFAYLINKNFNFLFTCRNYSNTVQEFLLLLNRHVIQTLNQIHIYFSVYLGFVVELLLQIELVHPVTIGLIIDKIVPLFFPLLSFAIVKYPLLLLGILSILLSHLELFSKLLFSSLLFDALTALQIFQVACLSGSLNLENMALILTFDDNFIREKSTNYLKLIRVKDLLALAEVLGALWTPVAFVYFIQFEIILAFSNHFQITLLQVKLFLNLRYVHFNYFIDR